MIMRIIVNRSIGVKGNPYPLHLGQTGDMGFYYTDGTTDRPDVDESIRDRQRCNGRDVAILGDNASNLTSVFTITDS